MKRLYVGGLGHTISEKDLKDRFGKFGEVSDVEIKRRIDEQGLPLTTFAYVNINISDADYKRCVTVLNKSKWKGGTLQIELAKESFFDRLAKERQQVIERARTPKPDPQKEIVESFKAAGVENFHLKAAVPGTEIPGHKDWVVSKFGRVLPVLHLKCQGKNKVLKYDPSKHCHNIRKLDVTETVTPVSKLTWEVEGGYDEISKRRRGEFPPQKKSPKKASKDLATSVTPCAFPKVTASKTKTQIRDGNLLMKEKQTPSAQKSVCVLDSDADSEDEIRMLVASQNQMTVSTEDNDNLEVVGDDFVVKSSMFWGGEEFGVKGKITSKSSKNDEEYDSADTDEILIQNKNPGKNKNSVEVVSNGGDSPSESAKIPQKKGKKTTIINTPKSPSTDSSDESSEDSSDESIDSDYEALMGNCQRLDLSLTDLEHLVKNMEAESEEESDGAQSESEAGQFDLHEASSQSETQPPKASTAKSGNNPEDILASLFGPDLEKEKGNKKAVKLSLPAFVGSKDLFGSTACLKRPAQNTDCEFREEPKRLKDGSKAESEQSDLKDLNKDPKSISLHQDAVAQNSTLTVPTKNKKLDPRSSSSTECSSSSDEMESSEEITSEGNEDEGATSKTHSSMNEKRKDQATIMPLAQVAHSSGSSTSGESKDAEEDIALVSKPPNPTDLKPANKRPASKASLDNSTSSEESESSDEGEKSLFQKSSAVPASKQANKNASSHPKALQQSGSDMVKQQQDNQKRIAAMEQRQKETEQQKKLIQGALSNLDLPKANKGKHIVFDSDDDEDNDDTENTAAQKKSLFGKDSDSEDEAGSGTEEKHALKKKEFTKPKGSKLFDSSEEEDDGTEEDRFQIKPQFEGKTGQKLMELQSRFGTDSRFQMDARFLESDDEAETQGQLKDAAGPEMAVEQELAEEKKKNMAILQSVLNISIQPNDASKGSTKGKTFRDISALHYDPTSEAHAAFEKKTEPAKKESKAERRKKREEAKKLPEVSKEIYYDVAVDLKEVFRTSKESKNETKEVSWDKVEEEDEDEDDATQEEPHVSFSSKAEPEKDTSGGFKFSFFGNDPVTDKAPKTDEYKIETLKTAKVSWQVDPRFQDSSSDEDEVEEEEKDEKEDKSQSATTTPVNEPVQIRRRFFFFEDDIRLKEGPEMFWRCVKLEDQREAWEENRATLTEDYRKKHKDARRRHRATMKT